jgi:hypothetical protein
MAKQKVPVLAETQQHGSLNIVFQMIFAVANRPVNCPAFQVPAGASVVLRPINGSALNAQSCYAAQYPEALGGIGSTVIPTGQSVSVSYPVDNTCEIWAQGAAGDGLQVQITAAQVG